MCEDSISVLYLSSNLRYYSSHCPDWSLSFRGQGKAPCTVDLPANSTFFTMIRFLVHTGKMFTDGTDTSRHVFLTLKKLGTDFANLGI